MVEDHEFCRRTRYTSVSSDLRYTYMCIQEFWSCLRHDFFMKLQCVGFHKLIKGKIHRLVGFLHHSTMRVSPVISWFINSINYSYKYQYHKPSYYSILELCAPLSIRFLFEQIFYFFWVKTQPLTVSRAFPHGLLLWFFLKADTWIARVRTLYIHDDTCVYMYIYIYIFMPA